MDEIRKIPPVTRYILGGVAGVTFPVLLQLVSIYPMVFVPQLITKKFELWRLVSCVSYRASGEG